MTIAVTEAPEDPLGPLVLGWIAGKRSVHTRNAYRRDITQWLGWLATRGTHPLDITEPDVAVWARWLEAGGWTASTVARKLSTVSSWYTWLVRNGHVEKNPAEYVDRPEVDRDTSMTPGLTKEQALAFQAAADKGRGPQRLRNSAMVAVMLMTGLRVSEIILADIEDLGVNRGHRTLTVTRKGGKRQALALPPPVAERLDAYLASREDMASLPALPGEPGAPKPRRALFITENGNRLDERNLWHQIRALGKAAGLPADLTDHIGPHSLRHTALTLAMDAGVPLRDVQDLAGHADPRTTRRYDRSRHSLDRSASYILASYLAAPEEATG